MAGYLSRSDSTPSAFFVNSGKPRLDERGVERGVALSDDGMEQAGMGIGVGDYNLDGRLDIFKTHFSDDINVLYRNDGHGSFTEVTFSAKIGRVFRKLKIVWFRRETSLMFSGSEKRVCLDLSTQFQVAGSFR